MKKGCAVLIIILGCMFLAAVLMFRMAFGPQHRTVEISLGDKKHIICEETYSADLAGVFYDVKFHWKGENDNLLYLGETTFTRDSWSEGIKVKEVGNWILLPVEDGPHLKLLMFGKQLQVNRDTTFSLLNLKADSLWKSLEYPVISEGSYRGSSRLDSLAGSRMYVCYEYQISSATSNKRYRQTAAFGIDSITGAINTQSITTPSEIK